MRKFTKTRSREINRRLLATVCVAALMGLGTASSAASGETGKPMIELEIGGQLDQLTDNQTRWVPDFETGPYAGPLAGIFQDVQKTPRYGFDTNVGLSFRPGDEGWVLSASVWLGRARQPGSALKQDHILPSAYHVQYGSHYGVLSNETENHLFVDFSVGKDVGLGIAGSESTISGGVRIANLRSRSDVHISSNFPQTAHGSVTNVPDGRIKRKFQGTGPFLAWKASAPVAGRPDTGELGIDWGLKAGLLFGRQTVSQSVHGFYVHRTNVGNHYVSVARTAQTSRWRERNATVPNAGAYAAVYYRFPNAKLSLGYRADWFFNALDGGVTSTQLVDRGFFGPFASISIGF